MLQAGAQAWSIMEYKGVCVSAQVEVALQARMPSSSGRQGEGPPYFHPPQPLRWTLGEGTVDPHIEDGITSMAKGEHAFLSCPLDLAAPSGLVLPPPESVERVEYEIELRSMVQVCWTSDPFFA